MNNGIFIKSFYNDPEDRELDQLLPFLKYIVENKVADVRPEVKRYREMQNGNLQRDWQREGGS